MTERTIGHLGAEALAIHHPPRLSDEAQRTLGSFFSLVWWEPSAPVDPFRLAQCRYLVDPFYEPLVVGSLSAVMGYGHSSLSTLNLHDSSAPSAFNKFKQILGGNKSEDCKRAHQTR
jgi:hypothetical protein